MAQAGSEHPIVAFDGAIVTRIVEQQGRVFAFEVTFQLDHPHLLRLSAEKPPRHFHPFQAEYIQVLHGRLGVEIGSAGSRELQAADGEVRVPAGTHHRLFPPRRIEGDNQMVFLLAGDDTARALKLDTLFFQNWYGYQDEVLLGGKNFDLIQVLSTFDAGGSYLSLPYWVPFGRSVSRILGIVLGRGIGGLLGYQPYYRKWSGDWDLACQRMRLSLFQRRFAHAKTL